MSAAANTTSNYIYRMGTSPNTRAAVSQKNKVYGYMLGKTAFQQLGVVSEFGHDESRSIEPVRGVGFGDQIAELVPGVTEPMTLTLNKTLLYALNLFQSVGYKGGVDGLVRSLRHHRWPFDIKQELVISDLIGADGMPDLKGAETAVKSADAQPRGKPADFSVVRALFTYYEGCWFNQYGASYTADAAIVAENSSVTVTDVIDGASTYGEFVSTGLAPITNNGSAGKGYSLRFDNNTSTAPTVA
jgi:hypothetical protein